jgi:hypothetical protein
MVVYFYKRIVDFFTDRQFSFLKMSCQKYGNSIPPIGCPSANVKLNIYEPNDDRKLILCRNLIAKIPGLWIASAKSYLIG